MSLAHGILGVLVGLSVAACQASPQGTAPSLEADLAAISEAREALVQAIISDDVPGIMARLTHDHLTMPPDGPTPPDSADLAAWHQARIDQFQFQADFTTDAVEVRGDIAIERWSSSSRLTPRSAGEPVDDSTKGVWIWERQSDGSWKLMWSIWNSNLPV